MFRERSRSALKLMQGIYARSTSTPLIESNTIEIPTRFLLVFVAMVHIATPVQAAPQTFEQYPVLAALTLNFARFSLWPNNAFPAGENAETLNICLVGDNVVQQSFDAINGKTAATKTIKVINAERLRNLAQCHVLFIAELEQNLLVQVFLDVKAHPVLTIGETDEFIEAGGMVGMINKDGKIQLSVNLEKVKASGLTISSNLLKLAQIVGNPAN